MRHNKFIISAIFSTIVLLALAIDMTPTKLRKMSPDTTLYNSQQTDVLVSNAGKVKKIIAGTNITISPTSGEGDVTINSTGGSVAEKRIAMFIIPMNQTSSSTPATAYKHFELKASYNNFSPDKTGAERCCYYVHSGHADEFNILQNDKARIYVNHGGTDQRSYVKIANTLTELTTYAPSDYVVLVDVTQCWPERSDGSWLYDTNDNLMWTFVKTMNNAREIDAGTDHCLWRPIQPVKWFSQMPNWANQ